MALTDAKIRNTKPSTKAIKLTDGGGLYLEVRPTGSKLWRYRYRIAGNSVHAQGASDARILPARCGGRATGDIAHRQGVHRQATHCAGTRSRYPPVWASSLSLVSPS